MRVGVLTAGGDAPGLNAVIRAVVRKAERHYGDEVIGLLDGYKGLVENRTMPLDIEQMRGTLPRGGTVLGTSREQPFKMENGLDRAAATVAELELDAVIAIGGEGSLACARELHRQIDLPMVGVPKTIDNDVGGTEMTFGFETAVEIATEAIDRLHTTAESHDRVIVCEVMGRHVGHIATWAGIAGGATMTLIPEVPFDIDEVCEALKRRHERGRYASIIVVAEGASPKEGTLDLAEPGVDEYGHQRLGGISNVLATEIEKRTGYETRVTILGHVQRGGTPTAFDRVLSTRYGVAAIDAVHEQKFGHMVSLSCGRIVTVPLVEALTELDTVDPQLWDVATQFFA